MNGDGAPDEPAEPGGAAMSPYATSLTPAEARPAVFEADDGTGLAAAGFALAAALAAIAWLLRRLWRL